MNPSELLADPVADLDPAAEFTTRGRTITEADLTSFSALTGDWHPQHSDAEWASQSRFGSRVAHGMLVLSYALGLVPSIPIGSSRSGDSSRSRSSGRLPSETRSGSREASRTFGLSMRRPHWCDWC
jgi:MaoC like domain